MPPVTFISTKSPAARCFSAELVLSVRPRHPADLLALSGVCRAIRAMLDAHPELWSEARARLQIPADGHPAWRTERQLACHLFREGPCIGCEKTFSDPPFSMALLSALICLAYRKLANAYDLFGYAAVPGPSFGLVSTDASRIVTPIPHETHPNRGGCWCSR
ncbi:hypothetical protein MKEN_00172200 [Mycena kentingensis (nom. inval.)]|nr:hypothetical protein MKEN_00172200 [Mycena kentingensis (nom. inval.)]